MWGRTDIDLYIIWTEMDAELAYLDLITAPVRDMGHACATTKTNKGIGQFWIYEYIFIIYISEARLNYILPV